MAKQYIATIMNRIYLGEDNYIYYPSYTAIGSYDDDTKIFTDRNGRAFLPITNEELLTSEVTEGYHNMEELHKLPEITGNSSLRDAISEFDYYYSDCIYYVSMTYEDGLVFSLPINLSTIRESVEETVNLIKNGKLNLDDFIQEEEQTDEVRDKELGADLRAAFASFFMELLEGKYSIDDLKLLRDEIVEKRDDIDSLIDSIDLQIDATEHGESSITLKDEEKVVKKKRRIDTGGSDLVHKKPNIKQYLDIIDLYNKITQTLIAQDEPLRRVLTEIARKEQSDLNNDRGILITGATGTGKTKMMELIAKYLDRPFLKVDSTQLTIPGYVGKDIEEVLWELYIKCGKDVSKAERAIVFFDEIDKKGSSKKDDVSGKGVLNTLLPFFDGSTYDACENTKTSRETVKINTKNMLVILGGAFEDVYGELRGRIGFNADLKTSRKKATTQDFIDKAQMPAEFMGRVAIVKLNDLELEDIKRILLESDESALKIQEKLFDSLGVKLTSGDDYINAIAKQAMDRKTGARGLNTVVDETTWEAYGDVYTHLGEYDEIILGEGTVKDPKVYQKVYKKK